MVIGGGGGAEKKGEKNAPPQVIQAHLRNKGSPEGHNLEEHRFGAIFFEASVVIDLRLLLTI